jgi:hypothetical protein
LKEYHSFENHPSTKYIYIASRKWERKIGIINLELLINLQNYP